jgi:hypothetical protein
MKKLALMSTLVLSVCLVPSSASAGDRCISRPEYRRIDLGMRQARVRAIVGYSGDRIHNGPYREEYAYDICSGYQGSVVLIDYRRNHVSGKSWLYGE